MSLKGFWGRGRCAGAPVYCRRPSPTSPCYCLVVSVVVVVDIVVESVDILVVVVVGFF